MPRSMARSRLPCCRISLRGRAAIQLPTEISVFRPIPGGVDGGMQARSGFVLSPFVEKDEDQVSPGLHKGRVQLQGFAYQGLGFARPPTGGERRSVIV